MDREEIIENISESVLWTVVTASVEKDDQLPVILKDIHYLGDKENLLARTTWCEVFDSYDWENVDFDGMNKQELLDVSRDLVEIVELHYTDVEADNVEVNYGH